MYGNDIKRVRELSKDDTTYVIAVLMEKCFPNDSNSQHEYLESLLGKVEF